MLVVVVVAVKKDSKGGGPLRKVVCPIRFLCRVQHFGTGSYHFNGTVYAAFWNLHLSFSIVLGTFYMSSSSSSSSSSSCRRAAEWSFNIQAAILATCSPAYCQRLKRYPPWC